MTMHEGYGYRNVTISKCLMQLIKVNINLSKYALEGMYFLTLTKCLLTHQMSEHVIWMRTRKNWSKHAYNDLEMEHPLRTQTMITEMGNNKTGNSRSKVF